MARWLKVVLWVAVVVLPGGLLLAPLLVAVHRRERVRRDGRRERDSSVTSTVAV